MHEDGYCDRCGCKLVATAWLTFGGEEFCESCAVGNFTPAVRVATKPEARDDGR
jgi:hypothetical protein